LARTTTVQLIDDIDGSQAAETVHFAVDGRTYEIDLSTEHAESLRRSLAQFVAVARRAGRIDASTGRGQDRPGRPPGADSSAVRAWARKNGVPVSPRGRIPQASAGPVHQRPAGTRSPTSTSRTSTSRTGPSRVCSSRTGGSRVAGQAEAEPTQARLTGWNHCPRSSRSCVGQGKGRSRPASTPRTAGDENRSSVPCGWGSGTEHPGRAALPPTDSGKREKVVALRSLRAGASGFPEGVQSANPQRCRRCRPG